MGFSWIFTVSGEGLYHILDIWSVISAECEKNGMKWVQERQLDWKLSKTERKQPGPWVETSV